MRRWRRLSGSRMAQLASIGGGARFERLVTSLDMATGRTQPSTPPSPQPTPPADSASTPSSPPAPAPSGGRRGGPPTVSLSLTLAEAHARVQGATGKTPLRPCAVAPVDASADLRQYGSHTMTLAHERGPLRSFCGTGSPASGHNARRAELAQLLEQVAARATARPSPSSPDQRAAMPQATADLRFLGRWQRGELRPRWGRRGWSSPSSTSWRRLHSSARVLPRAHAAHGGCARRPRRPRAIRLPAATAARVMAERTRRPRRRRGRTRRPLPS